MSQYVITNDWHIGSEVCQREKIIEMLKTIDADVLILNGDIIDVDHVKRLKKKDWEILSLLRKLSKKTKIVYIRGNHDNEIAEMISGLLGFEFRKELDFTVTNKKFHVTHGDFFDSFISNFPILTEIGSGLYYWLQRFSPKKQALARSLKRSSKRFIKCCESIKKRAEHHANAGKHDYVVCGHSHLSYIHPESSYINTGCFTEIECTYLKIDNNGNPTLVKIT